MNFKIANLNSELGTLVDFWKVSDYPKSGYYSIVYDFKTNYKLFEVFI